MKINSKYPFVVILSKIVSGFFLKPRDMATVLLALIRGTFNIVYFRLARRNVRIRFPFFVYQKVTILGRGKVFIDRYCSIHPNVFHGLCIVTYSSWAEVKIGKHCSLGGLTVRCHNKVEIKDRVMTAYSLVQDSFFNHLEMLTSKTHDKTELNPGSICIQDNVWIGSHCCIIQESFIGEDSVIATGALCLGTSVRPFHLVSGSPSIRPVMIEKILGLRR